MSREEAKAIAQEFRLQIIILTLFVGVFWSVEVVDTILHGSLDQFGIVPRNLIGLRGILFAPFLHANFRHLIANTVPFVTLGWLVMLRHTSDFFVVTAISMLVGGMGTWLIGSRGFHIGASGVIFGYLGFLLSRGYFERKISSMLLSVMIGLLYGGLLWGVLPNQPNVSWEGHLFGFIGGAIAAKFLAERTIDDYDL